MGEASYGVDRFFDGIEKTAKVFYDNCKDIPYMYKGMSNVEGVFLWRMIEAIKPTTIFESGIGRGRGTEMLLRAQRHYGIERYVAVDIVPERAEWARGNGVEAYCSGAADAFETHICEDERTVCCVDGPKGGRPLVHLLKTMERCHGCLAMFTHDCVPKNKLYRTIMEFASGASYRVAFPPQDVLDSIAFVNEPYIESLLSMRPDVNLDEHLKRLMAGVFLLWEEI